MATAAQLRIDFVSDIACPWCAIGLAGLTQALEKLGPEVTADIHLQPFELNPQTAFEGQDANEELMHKYGIDQQQLEANRKVVRERGAAVGVTINTGPGSRVWNTFDAHRLLHFAELQHHESALALKQALFTAYFSANENVADHAVLTRIAGEVGLDPTEVRQVLDSNQYADAVRAQEQFYQQAGIHSVPATIINGKHLIPGGQTTEVFAQVLREIATKAAVATPA